MVQELSTDLIWCLQALSQDANAQRKLYPDFVGVADELVLDFDDAYSYYKAVYQAEHADLERLDAHIESKAGVLEFWTDEALDHSVFWSEIRDQAAKALEVRNLNPSLPRPSFAAYVSESGLWVSGRTERTALDDPLASVFSRLRKLFH